MSNFNLTEFMKENPVCCYNCEHLSRFYKEDYSIYEKCCKCNVDFEAENEFDSSHVVCPEFKYRYQVVHRYCVKNQTFIDV